MTTETGFEVHMETTFDESVEKVIAAPGEKFSQVAHLMGKFALGDLRQTCEKVNSTNVQVRGPQS